MVGIGPGVAFRCLLCFAYGIGGEVGSAKVAGCWSQPNANVHTGQAAIGSMAVMMVVIPVMFIVAVTSSGTSSGVCLRDPSLSRALW